MQQGKASWRKGVGRLFMRVSPWIPPILVGVLSVVVTFTARDIAEKRGLPWVEFSELWEVFQRARYVIHERWIPISFMAFRIAWLGAASNHPYCGID